jgi:hypothetical protein
MEPFVFFALVSFVKSLPFDNPAFLDIFKLIFGSTIWIGSMLAYMYWREQKLKTAAVNK